MPALAPAPAPPVLHVVPAPLVGRHKGFDIALVAEHGQFGYTIRQGGFALCASSGTFATAGAADRDARQFIDDALGAYDLACATLGSDA